MVMGETAEVVAKRYGISREAQDEYALVSQQRTARAQQDGFFDGEIAPFGALSKDECNRPDTTLDAPAQAAAGVRHDERHGQRHGRQLVAAVRRRVGDARDVDGSREALAS